MSFWHRWRLALAEAGTTQRAWAHRHGWSDQHVAAVVKGQRESETLMREMERYVIEQERKMRARLTAGAAA